MKKYSKYIFTFVMTCILMFPYFKGFLPIEHDTFFHVSRIEQLSLSIREGNFFPAIYPYENAGYGYGSPLFYSDVFLIVPSLLHILGLSLVRCYQMSVFAATWISGLTMFHLAQKITKRKDAAAIATCAYLFSNYHITDIYVRGALGEVFSLAVLPVLLEGLYECLYEKNTRSYTLCIGLTALALCHNLTFLFGVVLCILFFVIRIHAVDQKIFLYMFSNIMIAFLLTLFFTIPMIEQLKAQKMILHYYGTSGNLGRYAMDFWQYFANKTVFGLAGNDIEHDRTMLENVGYFLTFAPLLYIFAKEKKAVITTLCILGYIMILLPSSIIPWQSLSVFSIIQFPWRLNTLGILLLSIPAAYGIVSLSRKKGISLICILILSIECIYHVLPVTKRAFGMHAEMTWQDVLDGTIIDPYFSAYYVRVELAGGDYLPLYSPDFRGRERRIRDENDADTGISFMEENHCLSFTVNQLHETIRLPLTYYKGYQVYLLQEEKKIPVNTFEDKGMVSIHPKQSGTYICIYGNTKTRKICLGISLITLILCISNGIVQRYKGKSD